MGTLKGAINTIPVMSKLIRVDIDLETSPVVEGKLGATADRQLIEMWIHGHSPCTADYYHRTAYRLLAHTSKPLGQTTLADLQSFADALKDSGLAESSCRSYLAAVKSLLTFGNRLGVIPVNVGIPLRLPTPRDALTERILTETDVALMIRLEPDARNKVMLRLLYAGALRVSELCGLRWQDLTERSEGGQVTVFGKGSKTRVVVLPAVIWKELVAVRGEATADSSIFLTPKAKPMYRQQAWRIVKEAAMRIGIEEVSPHWFRHAHASHSIDRGAPIHLVQQTLGHSNVATTGRYLHARPSESSAKFLAL